MFGTKYLATQPTMMNIPARNRVFCAAQCEVQRDTCLQFTFDEGVCTVLSYQTNLTLDGLGDGADVQQHQGFSRLDQGKEDN